MGESETKDWKYLMPDFFGWFLLSVMSFYTLYELCHFYFKIHSLDLIGWLDFDTSVAPCSKIIGVCSSSFSFFLF